MSEYREPRQPLVAPGAIECHAADLTATISAEMPLKIAQWRLGEFDQWIPIDGDPDLPIGRLVEQNSTGPLRLGYGAWRDLLLGCQFRIGDDDDLAAGRGELITAGGRAMKNVAGYDLTKLMVGQRGFFGKIVTITVRTYRRPAMALVAKFAPSDALLGDLMTTPLRPRWAAMNPEGLWLGWLDEQPAIDLFEKLLIANRAGPDSSIEVKPIEIIRRSLSVDIAHRSRLWKRAVDTFRAAMPPTKILRFIELAAVADFTADAAFGIVVGSMGIGAPPDRGTAIRGTEDASAAAMDESRLRAAAERVGGSVTIFRAGGSPAWRGKPEELAILENLRAAFAR
jgi:hypothetical protein